MLLFYVGCCIRQALDLFDNFLDQSFHIRSPRPPDLEHFLMRYFRFNDLGYGFSRNLSVRSLAYGTTTTLDRHNRHSPRLQLPPLPSDTGPE